jgi:alginate O-acetyltransferase complex protein AlgI
VHLLGLLLGADPRNLDHGPPASRERPVWTLCGNHIMLFNSIQFAIFLPVVFAAYWCTQSKLRLQNLTVLFASYVFYGWWDWRFLSLIVISSAIDYSVGLFLERTHDARQRNQLLAISIGANLGILGIFKYLGFFAESLQAALGSLGIEAGFPTLRILLPVGISFYTFQTMSYTIDVYRKRMDASHDPLAFFAYVAFFPQLVAGPIERAGNLLPQFEKRRTFSCDEASVGVRQILWGLFKKTVIADTCGRLADRVFADYGALSSVALIFGLFFFAWQIYCDFSGYSDIAIGTARLFGFRLMTNFRTPYFSRDIAEFWRRWHISLSTWFRDYLYIPLGGSRGSRSQQLRNVVVVFLVSGLWHGAEWTFVVWGALNAIYFLPSMLLGKNRQYLDTVASGRLVPTLKEMGHLLLTFGLTLIAWAFFRANSVGDALAYLLRLMAGTNGFFRMADLRLIGNGGAMPLAVALVFICGLVGIEWVQKEREHAMVLRAPWWVRWPFYNLLVCLIIFFGVFEHRQFIYFQF